MGKSTSTKIKIAGFTPTSKSSDLEMLDYANRVAYSSKLGASDRPLSSNSRYSDSVENKKFNLS